jgi:putative oxidoreductase
MSSVQATRATPIIPFVAPLYRTLEPYAYTLIRITAGAIFIPHGVQKLFLATATTPLGYGLGVLELAGGALLALGILTRPIAILLLLHVAAIIVANYPKGWLWTRGGVQYHTFMFGMLLAVLIGGPGRYALGKWAKELLDDLGRRGAGPRGEATQSGQPRSGRGVHDLRHRGQPDAVRPVHALDVVCGLHAAGRQDLACGRHRRAAVPQCQGRPRLPGPLRRRDEHRQRLGHCRTGQRHTERQLFGALDRPIQFQCRRSHVHGASR